MISMQIKKRLRVLLYPLFSVIISFCFFNASAGLHAAPGSAVVFAFIKKQPTAGFTFFKPVLRDGGYYVEYVFINNF